MFCEILFFLMCLMVCSWQCFGPISERDQKRGVGRVSDLPIQKTDSGLVKLLMLEKRVNIWSNVRAKC
jgi:hypothetical protein